MKTSPLKELAVREALRGDYETWSEVAERTGVSAGVVARIYNEMLTEGERIKAPVKRKPPKGELWGQWTLGAERKKKGESDEMRERRERRAKLEELEWQKEMRRLERGGFAW